MLRRTAGVAALTGSLVLGAGAPASADEPVDGTKPVVTSTGRADGEYLGGSQRLTPVYSDNVRVVRVDFLINGELQRAQPVWPGFVSIPFEPHVKFDGQEVDLTVRAFDAAGNFGEAVSRVRVDTVAPVATFTPEGAPFGAESSPSRRPACPRTPSRSRRLKVTW
ncbi:hypothetical protein [Actinoplanes sp. DH11]|uniref:hypothetical protein n=1 Tax=Actinoplanes sp. DH11 TaxID=2857011 RepID=UPI001E32C69E|nr:hypothetical protein [Actinoplanes sp. DH11]